MANTTLAPNYNLNFQQPDRSLFITQKGLSKRTIETISSYKKEPEWMKKFRLEAFEIFKQKLMPTWGADLSELNFNEFNYFVSPSEKKTNSWDEVPEYIKETYERIGIPQAEQNLLAGVGAQYDSEVIYNNLKKEWEKQGVIFVDMDTAVKKYPSLIKDYFGKAVPSNDNKFSALNSAVWSGGSFIYIPKNVKVTVPLQAYFRINFQNLGQFERTLIIADEGSELHYIEGCSAPIYSRDLLHAAVVEIFVKKGARVKYTTIQNWSNNVYNLVTKRMIVEEEGIGEWVDGNIGSKVTMKYPAFILKGKGAKGELLSLSFAGQGQHQDTGGKAIHLAPYTTSNLTSKSISLGGGKSTFRGISKIVNGAKNSKSKMQCNALILDDLSIAETFPNHMVYEKNAILEHEATVSKIAEDQLFYLMSRGISEEQATSLIVNGFIEPIVLNLPFEYALELNRLIELSLEKKNK